MRKFVQFWVFLFALICCFIVNADDKNFNWLLNGDQIILDVANSCYVYADSINISAYDSNGKELHLVAPAKTNYSDELLGSVLVYGAGKHIWKAPYLISSATIDYQGCKAAIGDENGICYMPKTINLGKTEIEQNSPDITLEKVNPVIKLLDDFEIISIHEGEMSKDEFLSFLTADEREDKILEPLLISHGTIWMVLLVFIGGFLLNFTPCILPLIPINLAIIGASGNGKKGISRALIYGLGIMLAYGVLGLLVILTGARFGALNSSSIFNFVIAVIFVFLALALLDVLHLDFSHYQSQIKLDRWKNSHSIFAFLLGATAALLAGACVAPAVIAMLITASQLYNNSNYFGLILPFIFGAGMASPWPLGAWSLSILPRPGKWMIYVKYIFAIFIFGMAIYYGVLGYRLLPHRFNSEKELQKLEVNLLQAKANDKMVLIDFWASWCKNCLAMKSGALQDAAVKKLIADKYVFVEFQTEKFDDKNIEEILEYFKINGLPAFVILQPKDE